MDTPFKMLPEKISWSIAGMGITLAMTSVPVVLAVMLARKYGEHKHGKEK